MLALACVLLLCLGAAQAFAPKFPFYLQCDPRWGNDEMGVPGPGERSTICGEGCAMTSLSMALAGYGIQLPAGEITPGSMNFFLVNNTLYHCADGDCNNLVLNAAEAITGYVSLIGELPPPSYSEIAYGLANNNTIYLAHVRNQTHFVLLVGAPDESAGIFTVHDPMNYTSTYTLDEIHDIIMYQVHSTPLTENIPMEYPLYKQCDPRWGNDMIETQTICQVGCLMSSISMSLGGYNITISGQTSNPGTLNTWLRNNHGYTSGNDLIESVVPGINPAHISWPSDGMHPTNDLPLDTIRGYLLTGRVVIANVMHGEHFVLCIGFSYSDPDTIYVNDPGFSTLSYSYSQDVVGWRLFDESSP
eukprot:m.222825 g.222825  ORF g.222825 m.222825 type:complete len:360 (+) comp54184_c0_seq1:109-1188(+)